LASAISELILSILTVSFSRSATILYVIKFPFTHMKLAGTFECGFDRNLLTICPIGGSQGDTRRQNALFRRLSGTNDFVMNWHELASVGGQVSIMLNLLRHSEEADLENILARHAARTADASDDTESQEKQFRDLLQALPAAIYTTDAEGRITFFNRACVEFAGRTPKIGDMWCVTWKLFTPDGAPLRHEDCPMAIALKENRPVRNVEAIAERPDGSRICFMPYPTPLRDEAGRLLGAVNMLVDITTRKQAEERMMLLTGEVDHRSNNLLAVIQAMLRLTKADTAEEFQTAFQGRLSALANVQRLFSVSRWTGASIQNIIQEELRPYTASDGKRVSITGIDVRLPASLAQAIAVSVHELATNAAKYGSLSGAAGKIDISWQIDADDNLLLRWTESGGPEIAEPMRKGFGVDAIDGMIRTLCGRITRQWKPEGLDCELAFPGIGG
jgi:PAS domain S-box-containing protein